MFQNLFLGLEITFETLFRFFFFIFYNESEMYFLSRNIFRKYHSVIQKNPETGCFGNVLGKIIL